MNYMRLTIALAVVLVTLCAATALGSPITASSLLDPLSSLGDAAQPTWERYTTVGAASEENPDNARIAEQYGKLPLSFVENRGQLDSAVRYVIRGPQASAFFTDTGVTFDLSEPLPKDAETRGQVFRDFGYAQTGKPNPSLIRSDKPGPLHSQNPETTARKCAALRMEFEGANPNCRVEGIDELPGKVNYFTGSDSAKWHTDIPTFKGVIYRGVWPGVDVSYHGDRRQLKYDIRVAPGADLSQIRLRYDGAENLWLDDSGDLRVQTAVTTFVEKVPGIYQEEDGGKQALHGGYVLLDDHTVGFRVEGRNPDLPLVIDPASDLVYSTLLGGGDYDCTASVALDSSGCAYIAGLTASSDFPTTPGAFQRTLARVADAMVTKLNATGSALVYSTYLGGSGYDSASSIAVDSSGCAYVTGSASSDFPTTPGAFQGTGGGAFVTKLNQSGSALIYSAFLGRYSGGCSIALDSSGCAYVAGEAESSSFPTTPGAFQRIYDGYYHAGDAFVTKLNASGSALVYSTFLGGSDYDVAYAIAVDSSGCAYVAGGTSSSDFPTTPSAAQGTLAGSCDAFVTKLNATGSALVYSTFLGGGLVDQAYSMTVNSSGCAYVAGYTESLDYPTTPGAFQRTWGGGYRDAFVTKLNAGGSALVYSTFLGDDVTAYSIAVDSSGCAYVAGSASSNFPTTPGAFQRTYGGFVNAFVTKLNASASALVYSTYLSGSNNYSYALAIAIDTSGCAYVAGEAPSSNFPTTPGAFQRTYGGGNYDAFVTKLRMSPGGLTLALSPNPVTAGQSVTATAYAPGAASVTLSFSVFGVIVPSIPMTAVGGDTWTMTLPSSLLAAYRGSSMTVTATARLTAGGTAVQSETLWIGSGPTPPPTPGSSLDLWDDDLGAYGLASGSHNVLNPGGNPLNAELTVQQDLDLWFGIEMCCSGDASWSLPTGFGIPEIMGRALLVPPNGSVVEIGHFKNQGDSVTMRVNLCNPYAAMCNTCTVLLDGALAAIPGGGLVSPSTMLGAAQDFMAVKAVSDAATALFGTKHTSLRQWVQSAGTAAYSLKTLVTDQTMRNEFAGAFSKMGLKYTSDDLGLAMDALSSYDLIKMIGSTVVLLWQTSSSPTGMIDCTFEAVRGSSVGGWGPQMGVGVSVGPKASATAPPAQTVVTWQATPSATDWLVTYNITNHGTNPVWSFTMFYEPSVGAPTAVLDPPGWSHDLDATAGTVTWYTQGPGGWVNGDFGTAAIAPGNSLCGFGIRHTAPPDYSMCSCIDTAYGSCFAEVAIPALAQGISGAKMRMANDQVALSDKIVTAVFSDGSYYVEDPLRSCGIRVTGGTAPSVGDKVRIVGTLAIANGEAQVNATTCLKVDTGTVRPLGIPAKALGGGSSVGLQPGITGASGLNNIGLLVRTWGKVTLAGRGWFYLDDGSSVSDGSGVIGIYVDAPSMSVPARGSCVAVTGISSCDLYLGNVVNTLRPRSQADITIVLAAVGGMSVSEVAGPRQPRTQHLTGE